MHLTYGKNEPVDTPETLWQTSTE